LAAELGLAPAALADAVPTAHPLLRQRRDEAGGRVVFGGLVDEHSDWVLDQHRLKSGEALLPGTGYLDLLAWALAELDGGFVPFRVEGLGFAAPLKLGRGEQRRIELVIEPQGADAWRVELSSQGAEADDRQEHLSARIERISAAGSAPLALQQARQPREPRYAHPELRFGPNWQCLQRFEAGVAEAELGLALHGGAEASHDPALHPLHPGLFDMAIGAAQGALAPDGIDAARLLPFRYGCLEVLAPLPAALCSRQQARAEGENLVLQIDLLDAQGDPVLRLRDFVLKPARALAAAAPKPRPRSAVSANRLLEVGYREGFSPAEGVSAICTALGHAG
ncbi:MAG: polyketide synthase dehydratase domain-containing protein, partial [Aquimonas sp.]|nr:polyketide synthase dehydratase domain-containing protein [Aquimonas sp.]